MHWAPECLRDQTQPFYTRGEQMPSPRRDREPQQPGRAHQQLPQHESHRAPSP